MSSADSQTPGTKGPDHARVDPLQKLIGDELARELGFGDKITPVTLRSETGGNIKLYYTVIPGTRAALVLYPSIAGYFIHLIPSPPFSSLPNTDKTRFIEYLKRENVKQNGYGVNGQNAVETIREHLARAREQFPIGNGPYPRPF